MDMDQTVLDKCKQLADWNSHERDRMPEADFRKLVVESIADLAQRTDALRNMFDRFESAQPPKD